MQHRIRRAKSERRAVLCSVLGEFPVQIIDVNARGAKVKLGQAMVDEAEEHVLAMAGETYPVDVVWVEAGEAGLRFQKSLAPDMVARMR
ncbi:MAG: hypothetical protein AAF871_03005 [Pseudomonadota bacterium]